MKTSQILISVVWRVLALIMLLLCGRVLQSQAQKLRSSYDLSTARIGLMNGDVMRAEITAFTQDSLAVADKKIAPPGSRVVVQVRHSSKSVRCIVQRVTRDSIALVREDTADTVRVARMNIKTFTVKKRAKSNERLPDLWLPAASIKYIAMSSRGGATVGAIGGFMIGGIAGLSLGLDSSIDSNDPMQFVTSPVTSTIVGGMIGAGLGSALGSIRREMVVDGDRAKFQKVRKIVVTGEKGSGASG